MPSFSQLETHEYKFDPLINSSSLEHWYNSIRNIDLSLLSIGDICRACRQKIYCKQTGAEAIKRLQQNPYAGELFDGELLDSLSYGSIDEWAFSDEQKSIFAQIASAALNGNINLDEKTYNNIRYCINNIKMGHD